jgi:hypothetical protein
MASLASHIASKAKKSGTLVAHVAAVKVWLYQWIIEGHTDGGSVPVVRLISWSSGLLALASERISARLASPLITDLTSEIPSLPLHHPGLQICYSDPLGTPHTCVFLKGNPHATSHLRPCL